ncbi:tol-pal system protein YbgF [Limnohabitans sp. Rim8]|uniref:tol-pal system protein YbgF n=1 Tax=Limnohabitans sp. Rim8 TaxID=1100718 RepID=UPI0026036A08|nr:tol-pal system protein YbgF [Limnohabitans sp. Rim8]
MAKTLIWIRCVFVALFLSQSVAHAGLFEDDDARRAILDLRQRLEQLSSSGLAQSKIQSDEISKLRSAVLDLQGQIETLKSEQAKLRGTNEQLIRDLSNLQQRQKDVQLGVEDRLRKFDPVKVSLDGAEFLVDPSEKRDYDAVMAVFRKGDFVAAQSVLTGFSQRYLGSGYLPSVLFWLGNAQYANKDYAASLSSFKRMLSLVPNNPRASEAILAISNCQIELKDLKAARKTLEDLVSAYPDSEAAQVAKERLTRLK